MAIVDSCSKIREFTKHLGDADAFFEDIKTFDAVLMNFVIIGESTTRLSEALMKAEAHIPWRQIKGLRNIIAHNYFGVDAEEIWQIINATLPTLEQQILEILNRKAP